MAANVTQVKVDGDIGEALAALDRLGIRAAEVGKIRWPWRGARRRRRAGARASERRP